MKAQSLLEYIYIYDMKFGSIVKNKKLTTLAHLTLEGLNASLNLVKTPKTFEVQWNQMVKHKPTPSESSKSFKEKNYFFERMGFYCSA